MDEQNQESKENEEQTEKSKEEQIRNKILLQQKLSSQKIQYNFKHRYSHTKGGKTKRG